MPFDTCDAYNCITCVKAFETIKTVPETEPSILDIKVNKISTKYSVENPECIKIPVKPKCVDRDTSSKSEASGDIVIKNNPIVVLKSKRKVTKLSEINQAASAQEKFRAKDRKLLKRLTKNEVLSRRGCTIWVIDSVNTKPSKATSKETPEIEPSTITPMTETTSTSVLQPCQCKRLFNIHNYQ